MAEHEYRTDEVILAEVEQEKDSFHTARTKVELEVLLDIREALIAIFKKLP